MTKTIEVRDAPDALLEMKSRAALAGMSLSEYLLGEMRHIADRPTLDELRARLDCYLEFNPDVTPAEAIRAERDSR